MIHAVSVAFLVQAAGGLTPGPADLYVRVVDVGPGLCTITEIPNGHYMIYDAGHWQSSQCLAAAREIVDGDEVDLLVISHSDSDHLGEADELLAAFHVRHIVRTGMVRTSDAWENFNQAVAREAGEGASVMNLQSEPLVPGTTMALGDATVTLVAGWGAWTGSGLSTSERRNVVSIVVRVDYAGSEDAEAFMVANHDAGTVSLKADVIIAPHHGADNASSECFIRAVDPEFVVFSAGHEYQHPRRNPAERYHAPAEGVVRGLGFNHPDSLPGGVEQVVHRPALPGPVSRPGTRVRRPLDRRGCSWTRGPGRSSRRLRAGGQCPGGLGLRASPSGRHTRFGIRR